ncbi:P12 family lipoprotein (plasmid) [Borreliella finlandensis]|uniref:P12 family lipoprotein n=1 Tax=Borreliella finlandensis TaxID=498741 RepID=UPI003AF1A1B1
MRKNLFLYTLLVAELLSCNLNSKLSGNKKQKNNNDVKEVLNSAQEDTLNDLYSNQEEKEGFDKNFKERKNEDLIDPLKSTVSLKSLKNKVDIPNTTSIEHAQKKEIKKGDLIPYTNEEKKADKAIKHLKNVLENSKFSELIGEVCALKDEYTLIKTDFYNVKEKIENKKMSLMVNRRENRDKINQLTQLQNTLKIDIELDKLINNIDITENIIRSAALFFDIAQKRLNESIIKRLESKNNKYYALALSRQALIDTENALSNLESFSLKKIEVIEKKEEIKKIIKHAKTVLASLNKK